MSIVPVGIVVGLLVLLPTLATYRFGTEDTGAPQQSNRCAGLAAKAALGGDAAAARRFDRLC